MLLPIAYILLLCWLGISTETSAKGRNFARKFEGKFRKSEFSLEHTTAISPTAISPEIREFRQITLSLLLHNTVGVMFRNVTV